MDGSQVFVVRIWFQRAAFRASVRAVDKEETCVFAEPGDLLQFLCGAGTATAPTPPSPDREGST